MSRSLRRSVCPVLVALLVGCAEDEPPPPVAPQPAIAPTANAQLEGRPTGWALGERTMRDYEDRQRREAQEYSDWTRRALSERTTREAPQVQAPRDAQQATLASATASPATDTLPPSASAAPPAPAATCRQYEWRAALARTAEIVPLLGKLVQEAPATASVERVDIAHEREVAGNVRALAAELRDCLGPAVDKGSPCAPDGSACDVGSVCMRGTCTFCSGSNCSSACLILPLQDRVGCNYVVVRAQAAANPDRAQVLQRQTAAQWGSASAAAVTWADALDAALVQEAACRASAECVHERAEQKKRDAIQQAEANLRDIVRGLCEDITIRRNAVAAIARENSNPSGVRDLAVLHDNGADIQAMDPEIRRLKALYAAQIAQPGMITRKPFTEAMCK